MNAELFSLPAFVAGVLFGMLTLIATLLARKAGRKGETGDPLAKAVEPFLRGRWECSMEKVKVSTTNKR